MKILNDEEIHLKFLLGQSVYVEGIGDFRSPPLSRIVDITENTYNQSLSALLFDRDSLQLDKEFDELDDFQILTSIIYHDSFYRELFFYGLELHFNMTPTIHENGFIYFGELAEESILSEEKYQYVRKLVELANNIAKKAEEDEIIPGNEQARKFMEEIKRKEQEMQKYIKNPMNLHSIISAVGWKAQSFEFINQLNIYQLYDGYKRLGVIDNYHYTMSGIYAGTVDPKGIKMPDINWANILK